MAEPYIQDFTNMGMDMTSVVLDQEDFNDLCDELAKQEIFEGHSGKRTNPEMIEHLKAAKHLPMVVKGTKTQFLFDKFDIKTDKMSIIVRGHGEELAKNMGLNQGETNESQTNPERN